MTAAAAADAIRKSDPSGTIGLISAERHPPYARPPLSKALWKGEPESSIWKGTDKLGIDLRLGRRATALDPRAKTVTDDKGEGISYRKVLLATGGTPRRLPIDTDKIIYYRTFDDYRELRALANDKKRFAVLGGGFIGSEVAAALRLVGCEVVMLVPEDGIGARVFPTELSQFLVSYYREQGVDVRTGQALASLSRAGKELVLKTTRGDDVRVDAVVAGIGIQPNVELAVQAGLRVDNGVVVDRFCRTSHADVYAASPIQDAWPNDTRPP